MDNFFPMLETLCRNLDFLYQVMIKKKNHSDYFKKSSLVEHSLNNTKYMIYKYSLI